MIESNSMLTIKFIKRLIITEPSLLFNAESVVRIFSISKNGDVKFSFNWQTKELVFLEIINLDSEFIFEYFSMNEERKEKLKKLNG